MRAPADPFEPVEGKCNARKTDGSGLCRHAAGWGTDHVGVGQCRKHGGSTPNGRKHGASLVLQRQVAELLEEYRPAVEGLSAHEQLLGALAVATGMARVFEALVGQLPAGELWGPDHLGDARPHVAEVRLERWTGERARIAKLAVDAGVEERELQLREHLADALVLAMRMVVEAVLAAAADGMSPDRIELEVVPAAMRRAFMAIETQEAR